MRSIDLYTAVRAVDDDIPSVEKKDTGPKALHFITFGPILHLFF